MLGILWLMLAFTALLMIVTGLGKLARWLGPPK